MIQVKKVSKVTLQGINISHLGKRKIIFNNAIFGGYVSFLEGNKAFLCFFFCLVFFVAGGFEKNICSIFHPENWGKITKLASILFKWVANHQVNLLNS